MCKGNGCYAIIVYGILRRDGNKGIGPTIYSHGSDG